MVVKNKILPIGKKFFAINLCGIIFAKGECSNVVLNHEKIHTRQMLELLVIPFYILYVIEWIIRIFEYGKSYDAYRNISFEREAYAHQHDLTYLSSRPMWNFIRYMKQNSSASRHDGNLSR